VASPIQLALAAGLAIALVNGYFARGDGRDWPAVARTVLGWLLAFALAGYVGPMVADWLLGNVF